MPVSGPVNRPVHRSVNPPVREALVRWPATLVLVHRDDAWSRSLQAALQAEGMQVCRFPDIATLRAEPEAFGAGFYLVELDFSAQAEVKAWLGGLRACSQVGLVLLVPAQPQASAPPLEAWIQAGADLTLAPPVSPAQVRAAIAGVHRRSLALQALSTPSVGAWTLEGRRRRLIAPDGVTIELSAGDVQLLRCLLEAQGQPVRHEVLAERLGLPLADNPNLLHATVYRLRRRIGRATTAWVPLQTKARIGYQFRAQLRDAAV